MTRKEEIFHIANEIADNVVSDLSHDHIINLVYDCIQWADRTMLDKAVEWLEENVFSTEQVERDYSSKFRKAMEG